MIPSQKAASGTCAENTSFVCGAGVEVALEILEITRRKRIRAIAQQRPRGIDIDAARLSAIVIDR